MTALQTIKNFRQVSPEVATSGQPSSEHFSSMADAGYAAVINLALHDDPRYSLPDELADVRAARMDYVHIPVQFNQPTVADLNAFMNAMDSYRGKRVWVHCAANMRVSAFLGLYRVLRQGWDRTSAFDVMSSVWEPNDVWTAFIARVLESSPCSSSCPAGIPANDFSDLHEMDPHRQLSAKAVFFL
jgi:protein tyrosine phosphatase (PTP) superfamily phosphohydrolase (DUF442 family)